MINQLFNYKYCFLSLLFVLFQNTSYAYEEITIQSMLLSTEVIVCGKELPNDTLTKEKQRSMNETKRRELMKQQEAEINQKILNSTAIDEVSKDHLSSFKSKQTTNNEQGQRSNRKDAQKYDFSIKNQDKQVLFFHILSQSEHTVALTKGSSKYKDKHYEIPEKVKYEGMEYVVVSVDNKAFYERDGIKSIILPNTIQSIGYHAFEDCEFSSFVFPESLREVKEGAFDNTIVESSGLADILPEIVGKYYTKPNEKGGYRLYKATKDAVYFKNDVTGQLLELFDKRSIENEFDAGQY